MFKECHAGGMSVRPSGLNLSRSIQHPLLARLNYELALAEMTYRPSNTAQLPVKQLWKGATKNQGVKGIVRHGASPA